MLPDYQDDRYYLQNNKDGSEKGKDLESGQEDLREQHQTPKKLQPTQSHWKFPGLCYK